MKKLIKNSLLIAVVLMFLCGAIYPLAMIAIGQVALNNNANGSIITFNGKAVGSRLIGQGFTDKRFFSSRPSAVNYNMYTTGNKVSASSGGSNYAPSSKELIERVKKNIDNFLKNNPSINKKDIPIDLLTASGSGLDPDVSKEAAEVQIDAVSKTSGISKANLEKIINKYTSKKTFGVFGETRVNVLSVNLEIAKKLKQEGKL